MILWETFPDFLEQLYPKARKSKTGRKPTYQLMVFKMLILQQVYNLSDDKLEYQTHD
jgi:hypothetical protein